MKKMFQRVLEKLFDLILYIFVRPVRVDRKAIFKELERRAEQEYNERHFQKVFYKTRQFVTDELVVETFDNEENFGFAVSPYDMYVAKDKESMLKQIMSIDKNSRIYISINKGLLKCIGIFNCVGYTMNVLRTYAGN